MSAELDMLEGYRDGYADDRAEMTLGNRSGAYLHGWQNGRDDRLNSPRAAAAVIRQIGAAIVEAEDRL
jgi:hypothetical protein